ncbi:MAG: hypothetical protein ACK58N_02240 [Synechocystis sp.]|jgi:hypothetical protein
MAKPDRKFDLNQRLETIPRFERWLWLGIFVLGLLAVLNHAMWRDEVNGWLIARDSLNFQDFWHNIRYEGHPILWYSCLWLLNQITSDPLAMQLFHLALALTAIAFFLIYAPFTRLQKLLFALGYLPFYEYLIISRNYAFGMLGLFAFCSVFPLRKNTYLPLAACLVLMASSNAYALMISFCLAIVLVGEWLWQKQLKIELQAPFWNRILSIVIFALAVSLSILMLMPPSDSTLQGGADQWFLQWDFYRFNQAMSRIWNSYILILVPADARPLDVGLFSFLSLGMILIFGVFFSDYPVILGFYLLASGGIVLFTYLKFLGSARHYGHLYLVLITAYWLKNYYDSLPLITAKNNQIWQTLYRWSQRLAPIFLMVILTTQLIAGLVGYIRVVTLPYSASRAAADYLKREGSDRLTLVGSEDFAISPISGYINAPIYYPESQKFGSFVLFNQNRKIVDDAEILEQIDQGLMTQFQAPVVLILNHPLNGERQTLNIRPLAEFRHSFIGNEQYYLYQIQSSH